MKCDICKAKIQEIYLNKIMGTYIKNSKGKKKVVCMECQKKLVTKDAILEKL
jgi:hypothetical protein